MDERVKELRDLLVEARPLVVRAFMHADEGTERGWEAFLARIDAALSGAPLRTSFGVGWIAVTCTTCGGTGLAAVRPGEDQGAPEARGPVGPPLDPQIAVTRESLPAKVIGMDGSSRDVEIPVSAKRHKCMRCGGEFACRTPGCGAGYMVLPSRVERAADGSTEVVEHECGPGIASKPQSETQSAAPSPRPPEPEGRKGWDAYCALKMVDDAYWGDFCGLCGVVLSLEAQDEECGPQHTAVQLVHAWLERNPEPT